VAARQAVQPQAAAERVVVIQTALTAQRTQAAAAAVEILLTQRYALAVMVVQVLFM
jgi:hypothetical protein